MKKLTSNMCKLAEWWVANPECTFDDAAAYIGVDVSTIYRWVKDEKYQAYQHELCVNRFKSLEKLALEKLKENASRNNQKAIEYILDYMSYKAPEKVEVDSSGFTVNIGYEDKPEH